jgi:hypothetical protein
MRILRKIIQSNRNEVIGEWRKLNNEELHHSCCSPNIIRVTKLKRMKWVGLVARIVKIRMLTKF